MVILVTGLALMFSVAVALALKTPGPTAIPYWCVFAAVACLLGAVAISQQPIGEATIAGRWGSTAVRWGFRAGQGKLPAAAVISWVIWVVIGVSVITAVQHRSDLRFALMIVAWAVDLLALFYMVGMVLARRGPSGSLLGMAGVLSLMLGVSAMLWIGGATPAAKRLALLVAGGPPLFLGAGYGLFFLFMMTAGRNARWN